LLYGYLLVITNDAYPFKRVQFKGCITENLQIRKIFIQIITVCCGK